MNEDSHMHRCNVSWILTAVRDWIPNTGIFVISQTHRVFCEDTPISDPTQQIRKPSAFFWQAERAWEKNKYSRDVRA